MNDYAWGNHNTLLLNRWNTSYPKIGCKDWATNWFYVLPHVNCLGSIKYTHNDVYWVQEFGLGGSSIPNGSVEVQHLSKKNAVDPLTYLDEIINTH